MYHVIVSGRQGNTFSGQTHNRFLSNVYPHVGYVFIDEFLHIGLVLILGELNLTPSRGFLSTGVGWTLDKVYHASGPHLICEAFNLVGTVLNALISFQFNIIVYSVLNNCGSIFKELEILT